MQNLSIYLIILFIWECYSVSYFVFPPTQLPSCHLLPSLFLQLGLVSGLDGPFLLQDDDEVFLTQQYFVIPE